MKEKYTIASNGNTPVMHKYLESVLKNKTQVNIISYTPPLCTSLHCRAGVCLCVKCVLISDL